MKALVAIATLAYLPSILVWSGGHTSALVMPPASTSDTPWQKTSLPHYDSQILPSSTDSSSSVHSAQEKKNALPHYNTEFIQEPTGNSVHVGSICELSNGMLVGSWYGGTREGHKDVCIYLSTRAPGDSWGEPVVIASRAMARRELNRHIRKIGNPIIFADSEDRLYLMYVSIAVGGWSGSALNIKTSTDLGKSWSKSQRLTLSPFMNVSELVKGRPIELAAGKFVIPIYHEFIAKFPELLWLERSDDGQFKYKKTRMTGGMEFIQPELVRISEQNIVAYYRSCADTKRIGTASSVDNGASWSSPAYLGLPNPNAGVAALGLPDGRILLAFNDSKENRDNLRLAVSADEGKSFTRIATLEERTPDEEKHSGFAYPYMYLGNDNRVHIVYTWKRRGIKHVSLNTAWINAVVDTKTTDAPTSEVAPE